jgi:molecular chaperone DnaK (HSP70)
VVLVGGSTRIPKIQSMLTDFFGRLTYITLLADVISGVKESNRIQMNPNLTESVRIRNPFS